MSNIAKLKKKAAELEGKKSFDKALEIYEQVLTSKHAGDEERDVALYNRVGDLHYRIGNTEQAIGYYEQAADLYAEGGFFNNAIALCNKVLRYSPGRTIIYYKLGIISAKKGFNSDAKQNFLEYADRMQRLGKMDEAFRALKEFADLCPGQDDVRLMLAEQLSRANRKTEALEQLELLYDTLQVEGRTSEATATLERMKNLDPAFKPRRSITPRTRQKEGLVFLDLDFDDAAPVRRRPPTPVTPARPVAALADDAEAEPGPSVKKTQQPVAAPVEGLEPTSLDESSRSVASDARDEPADAAGADEEEVDSRPNELTFIIPPEALESTPSPSQPLGPGQLAPLMGNSMGIAGTIGHTPVVSVPALIGVQTPPSVPALVDVPAPDEPPATAPDDDFIDLGEWLERNRTPSSTRMVAHDEEPENDEQKDFGEMLDKFKAGISRNVDEEDFESHYDLGIAFREMGLLDEAIGSFQKASRGAAQRVRASEAIGQCFMDKGEAGVTMTVLERLVREPGMPDAQLVGVLYLLGRAAESLGRRTEAAAYFQRVLAVQIGFRDTANRLSALAG
jgi:tetratricopeptide (TPR) repeat protein